jgi:hypothetical protein
VEADDADLRAVRPALDGAAFPAKEERRHPRELAEIAAAAGALANG